MVSDAAMVLTWQELLDECSRVHTTRMRMMPWGELAEDSHMLDIWIATADDPVPAVVVPTRLHEPGFYVRAPDGVPAAFPTIRTDEELMIDFREQVDSGKVSRRAIQR